MSDEAKLLADMKRLVGAVPYQPAPPPRPEIKEPK